ncbi:uncharacterized protein [Cardiocondyla obscurior]|uniref:uncharacterized protein n=1 Tax=Cardiocondyla obscurior TaxID=286306 RepID=UPI0039655E61
MARDDSSWCPTKRRKVEGKRWNRSKAHVGTFPCLAVYKLIPIIFYHFAGGGERSLKAEGCCHGNRAHTRIPLIRRSEAYEATKISPDIALSPKTHKDKLSVVH